MSKTPPPQPGVAEMNAKPPFERVVSYLGTEWHDKFLSFAPQSHYLRSLFLPPLSPEPGEMVHQGHYTYLEEFKTTTKYPLTRKDIPGESYDKEDWWRKFLEAVLLRHGYLINGNLLNTRINHASASVSADQWKSLVEEVILKGEFWHNSSTGSRNVDEAEAILKSYLRTSGHNPSRWVEAVDTLINIQGSIDIKKGFEAASATVPGILSLVIYPTLDVDFNDPDKIRTAKESVTKLKWYIYLREKLAAVSPITIDFGEFREGAIDMCRFADETYGPQFWDEYMEALRDMEDIKTSNIFLDYRKLRPGCLCRLAFLLHDECARAENWYKFFKNPNPKDTLKLKKDSFVRYTRKEFPGEWYQMQQRWAPGMKENLHIDAVMLPGDYRRNYPARLHEWFSVICPFAACKWAENPDQVPTCDILDRKYLPINEWISHTLQINGSPAIENKRIVPGDRRNCDGRCIECMQTVYMDENNTLVEDYFQKTYGHLGKIECEPNQGGVVRLTNPSSAHLKRMEYFKKGFERYPWQVKDAENKIEDIDKHARVLDDDGNIINFCKEDADKYIKRVTRGGIGR